MFRNLIATALILLSAGAAQARDIRTAIFAGGCFWCVEADFESVDGVIEAVSGYTGGDVVNPTYKQVSRGGTGHYEAAEITYDADIVSYEELMDVFWHSVDPIDAGGQFCDRGESYRTAVFYLDDDQKRIAEATKAAIDASGVLPKKIVTPILKAGPFYKAEDYHQGYYESSRLVLTRFGPLTKAAAYKRYREGCGRDKRLRELWGDEAFAATH
jgi:peptide-methionine (S)-S-oxide reductase